MNAVLHLPALNELQQLLGTDLLPITQMFAEQLPLDVQHLHSLWAAGDSAALRQAAHALKGSCANLGAVEVARRAALIEKNALGADAAALASAFDGLELAASHTLDALRQGGFLAR